MFINDKIQYVYYNLTVARITCTFCDENVNLHPENVDILFQLSSHRNIATYFDAFVQPGKPYDQLWVSQNICDLRRYIFSKK